MSSVCRQLPTRVEQFSRLTPTPSRGLLDQIIIDQLLREVSRLDLRRVQSLTATILNMCYLSIYLHSTIRRYELIGNLIPIRHCNATSNDGVVFEITHGNEVGDVFDTQKVQYIRHKGLMSSILNTCDNGGVVEVFRSIVASSFPPIVHHVLHNFLGGVSKIGTMAAEDG